MSQESHAIAENFLEYIYVLDQTYTTVGIIDVYEDFVWTEKFIGCGNFELKVPISLELAKLIKLNYYLTIPESSVYMIIETMEVDTDVEDGDWMKLTGRSLESILERRIIWNKITAKGSLQDAIKKMIDENAINPSVAARKIPGLSFKVSKDKRVTDLTEESIEEEHGNLYSTIESYCSDKHLGFRVMPKGSGEFEFELYFGTDRSWENETEPTVLFSDSYENLLDSRYIQSEIEYASNALVGAGSDSTFELTRKKNGQVLTGLNRREVYISASGETTAEQQTDAKKSLNEHNVTKDFDGKVDPFRQFIFGVDYFVGDIVQLENKYGYNGRCRITEVQRSRDASGPMIVPTFEVVEEDEEIEGS